MPEKAADIFLRTGVLTKQGLQAAQALKQRDGGTISEAILRLGLLDEEHLVAAFQKNLMIPRVSAAALARVPRDVLSTVPPHMAAELRVIPTDIDSTGNLTLAMVDPTDDRAADEVAAYTQRQVQRAVASPTAMREALRTHYGVFLNKPGASPGQSGTVAPVNVKPAASSASSEAIAAGQAAPSSPAQAPAAQAAQAPAQTAAKPAAAAPAAAKPAAAKPAAATAAKPAAAAAKPAAAAAKPAAAAPAAAKPAAAAPAAAKPAAAAAKPAAAAPAAAKPAAAAPTAAKPAAAAAPAAKPAAAAAPAAKPAAAPVAAAKPAAAPVAAAKPAAAPVAAAKPAAAPVAAAKPAAAPVAAAKPAAAPVAAAKPAAAPATAAKGSEPAAAQQEVDPHSLKALARALNPGGAPAAAKPAAGGVAPPAEAKRFAKYIDRMHAASERDEVVNALLDFATELSDCAALFVQQQKQLACLDGRGPDHVVMGMKWFTVAGEEQSPFNDVMASRQPHIGKLPDTATNRSAMASLSSSSGPLLLLPITFGSRAIGVLYADELKTDLKPLTDTLQYIAQETGASLARIILAKKKSS